MEDTVNNAMSFGKPGDTVLLAPAAASGGLFALATQQRRQEQPQRSAHQRHYLPPQLSAA